MKAISQNAQLVCSTKGGVVWKWEWIGDFARIEAL